ncbi:tetratricopeptide repeat protein [Chloroflexota bacterium]
MSYEREDQARQIWRSSKQAIALAMEGRWREAVAANKGIIEHYPADIDAFNRLGRAHMELGEYTLAREAYGRAKEIDPYSTIADKNLRRLDNLKETGVVSGEGFQRVEPQVFIEETGKAGVVSLRNLADKKVLAETDGGDKVNLKIEGSRLVVEDSRGRHLGQVEPKHSQRLIRLMQGGNTYSATVISSSDNMLAVIIREVYQYPSQEGQLSFPSKGLGSLRPYVSDKILRRQIEFDETAVEPTYIDTGEDDTEMLSDDSIDEGDEEAGQEV